MTPLEADEAGWSSEHLFITSRMRDAVPMAVIVKVQAQWQGFQGAPGYTNWYGLSDGDALAAANALSARMRTLFNAVSGMLPTGSTVKVQRLFQTLDSITGHITAEASLTTDPSIVTGAAGTAYAAQSGAVINWETGAFNAAGHRVRARTYLVPLAGVYDTAGSLSSGFMTTLQTAATAAVGGTGGLICWSRPFPKGASNGQVNVVTAAVIHDKACTLRSRRD